MAYFKLTTYISNCLLLRIRFNFEKNDFWYFIYFKFKIFFAKYILKKKPFWATDRFYSNTVLQSYTDYLVNGETYSLDMHSTS